MINLIFFFSKRDGGEQELKTAMEAIKKSKPKAVVNSKGSDTYPIT